MSPAKNLRTYDNNYCRIKYKDQNAEFFGQLESNFQLSIAINGIKLNQFFLQKNQTYQSNDNQIIFDNIFDMQREDRQDRYHKKKNNDQKDKCRKEQSNQDEKVMLDRIRNSSMESLLNFLETKYDRDKISKFQHKLNNEIIKKLLEFKNLFKINSIAKIIHLFKKYANIDLSQKSATILIDKKSGHGCLTDIPDICGQVKKGLRLQPFHVQWKKSYLQTFNVTFNLDRPDVVTRCIYCGKTEQQIYFEPAYKRIQKEAIEILEKFIQLEDKINSLDDK